MKKILLFSVIVFMVYSCGSSKNAAERKEVKEQEKAEKIEKTKAALESKSFVFVATQAIGQKGFTVNVAGQQYTFTAEGDSGKALLPFYGRAYSTTGYGEDGGVEFDSPLEEVDLTYKEKKRMYVYKAKAKRGMDIFDLNLEVFEEGSATLIVSQTSRTSMTYYGDLEPLPEKEKE